MNTQATALNSIKSDIIERLNDYKGGTYCGCDLAYKLFEGENTNGSVFCNTYKTVEFIKANFELFGELVEYYQDNFSETLNPFTEPEKAHVILLLEASQSILSKCDFIERNWNEQFELTETAIEEITEQVNDFNGDLF